MWMCHSIERSISVPGRALALSPCGALAAESCCLVADAFPSVQERVQAVDVVLGRQLHHEGGVWSEDGYCPAKPGLLLA